MLMKLSNRGDESGYDGVGTWKTALSWYEDGDIHPVTALVTYSTPNFEVVGIDLDYDRSLDIPDRMESMIIATALDEYLSVAPSLKKNYRTRLAVKPVKSHLIDPLFEE